MFNFTNISTSLYELYTTQFGKTVDRDIVQRMLLLRRSKSALLCPLMDQDDLIGSLELYRLDGSNQGGFGKEVEARLKVFTNQLQETVLMFWKMRTTFQCCTQQSAGPLGSYH